MRRLRVLVVDDSLLYRRVLQEVIGGIEGCEYVGSSSNGRDALLQITEKRPDLVTLDVEMPLMGGLEVLRELVSRGIACRVVMVSAFTRAGSKATIEALELGAFDFITKPDSEGNQAREIIAQRLRRVVEALRCNSPAAATPTAVAPERAFKPTLAPQSARTPEVIAIGVSTGGPQALSVVLQALPADFPLPLLIVQHMPPMFTASLAESLDRRCAIHVREATHGESVLAGHAYVAPGGSHMRVESSPGGGVRIAIGDEAPERGCKPSADYLFRSVAGVYQDRAIGIIMTGLGSDGTLGLMHMKRRGAMVLAQNEASCTVYGMPREAKSAGVVDLELPLSELGAEIMRRSACRAGSPGH